MRPAILDQLSAAKKAKLLDELVEFLATPSFGAWPKREIEVRVVAALYERQLRDGSLSVARLAEELTVTRARGRSLVLEARTRLLSRPEDRTKTLRRSSSAGRSRRRSTRATGGCASSSRTRSSATCCETTPTPPGSRSTPRSRPRSSRSAGATTRRCSLGPAGRGGGGGREGRRRRDPPRPRGREGVAGRVRRAMKKWEKRSPQERADQLLKLGIEHVPVSTIVSALLSAF